jgi:hypothetical protein
MKGNSEPHFTITCGGERREEHVIEATHLGNGESQPEASHSTPEGGERGGNVKGEPLVSKALAEGLCYKARHGVRLFPFGFRLELDFFLYRTC